MAEHWWESSAQAAEALAHVVRPIERAGGLPNEAYVSARVRRLGAGRAARP